MLHLVRDELARSGARCTVVSASRLAEIRQDLQDLERQVALNGFQRWIIDELYLLEVPEEAAGARSILIVAAPTYASRPVTFHRDGKSYRLVSTAGVTDAANEPENLAKRLNALLGPHSLFARYEPRLPRKRLAVRSGLARYGRNNLTYIEGLGSWHTLALFFSNLPCSDETWGPVELMPTCQICRACVDHCPTGAIRADRVLIDNERCLTRYNESAWPEVFPAWIPASAHNAVFECLRCQTVCPANAAYLARTAPAYEFDDQESALLLRRVALEDLPQQLRNKLAALGWAHNLAALARNLEALLAQGHDSSG